MTPGRSLRARTLAGRTAVVTGAGRNIGRAIALALAREGANVTVNGRSRRAEVEATAEAARALGVKALPFIADVSRSADVKAMIAATVAELGGVDILVNAAAAERPVQSLAEITDEDWQNVLGVILDGAFYCARAAIPHMVVRGGGSVINISGSSAFRGKARQAHVVAAKAALLGLTRALALEFGPANIRVNTIVPDLVVTERLPTQEAEARSAQASRPTALGRNATPEDIADACAFLAGDESRFITGQSLHVNGGTILT